MPLTFEWDEGKAQSNRKKHGVSFEEASTIFNDPLSLTTPDPLHSEHEDRLVIIGRSESLRLLIAVHIHTAHQGTIRLISARQATAHERKTYEEDYD